MVITDANGTLRMRGPGGSTFTLASFLTISVFPGAGLPRQGIYALFGPHMTLTVNGNDVQNIDGYSIQNGDHLVLTFLHSIVWT